MIVGFKNKYVDARCVSVHNLELLAEWCKGQVRGTALPRSKRIVQFTDHMEIEQDAKIGEWIIKMNNSRITVVANNEDAHKFFQAFT